MQREADTIVVVDLSMSLAHIKERLSEWRGGLVNMPLHFLEDEKVGVFERVQNTAR